MVGTVLQRLFLCALLGLGLTGCVTASNTLSPDQVSSFRLKSVSIRFEPGAQVRWGDGERAFAARKGASALEADAVANTAEGQASIRQVIAAKLKDAMEAQLRPELTGTRPINIDITVRNIEIASAAQRLLLGGHHRMTADTSIVEAKTGAVLLAFSQQSAIAPAGQGVGGVLLDNLFLGDPIDRVIQNYASQYRNWLLQK